MILNFQYGIVSYKVNVKKLLIFIFFFNWKLKRPLKQQEKVNKTLLEIRQSIKNT